MLRFRNATDANRIIGLTAKLQTLDGIQQVTWDRGN
jgi:hypothetical protein